LFTDRDEMSNLLLLPIRSLLKAECNYPVHVRTVQLRSVLITVKNRVEHYLHMGLHGKGNIP
jgi:hypothetical protein